MLRWDREVVLFDPGEAPSVSSRWPASRRAASRGSASPTCTATTASGCPVCCSGIALDGRGRPVDLYFPAEGSRTSTASATPAPRLTARRSAIPGLRGRRRRHVARAGAVRRALDHRVADLRLAPCRSPTDAGFVPRPPGGRRSSRPGRRSAAARRFGHRGRAHGSAWTRSPRSAAARRSRSSWTPGAARLRSSCAVTSTSPCASRPTCASETRPRRALRPPDRRRRRRDRRGGRRPPPGPHALLRRATPTSRCSPTRPASSSRTSSRSKDLDRVEVPARR